MSIKNKQIELFEKIKFLSKKVNSLGSYIQNSFPDMIEDGRVTAEDIEQSLSEASEFFDEIFEELGKYKNATEIILKYYIDNFNKFKK